MANPTWDSEVYDDWTSKKDVTPTQLNAHGEALNDLRDSSTSPGCSRIGIDEDSFQIDGDQNLDNLLKYFFSGTPGSIVTV